MIKYYISYRLKPIWKQALVLLFPFSLCACGPEKYIPTVYISEDLEHISKEDIENGLLLLNYHSMEPKSREEILRRGNLSAQKHCQQTSQNLVISAEWATKDKVSIIFSCID